MRVIPTFASAARQLRGGRILKRDEPIDLPDDVAEDLIRSGMAKAATDSPAPKKKGKAEPLNGSGTA
jgi:hypothetical protein